MERKYVVTKDIKSGLWYAHRKDYPYNPVSGSFSEKKSEAMEYAKMYNLLPNRVQQIEDARREKWMREMGIAQ